MKTSRRSIIWSFNYAISGIVHTLRTERNMRVHMAAAVIVAIASLLLGVSRIELVSVVFAISLVFMAELLNTAIEAAVDVSTDHYDPIAKVAKDVAAGAVLVAAVNALIVAYLVLFDPARRVLQRGFDVVRLAAPDITIITLGMVILAVLIGKAVSRQGGTWMEGGWPSGHAALAFAAAALVGYFTQSAAALMLGFFIAFLVVQSRVEAEIHTIPQSIIGALLGMLVATAVFQFWSR